MPSIIRPTSGNNTELGFSSPHRDNTSRSTQEKSIFTPRFRFAFVVTRSPRPISALSFCFSLRFVCRRGFDVAVTKRNFRPVFEGIVLGKVYSMRGSEWVLSRFLSAVGSCILFIFVSTWRGCNTPCKKLQKIRPWKQNLVLPEANV